MSGGLQLGAPGVYRAPPRVDRSFRPVRLDVAGFVGVAPRGPVDEPVLVQSWTDYTVRFGGFEGPGLLPYAVATFFEQGGQRAHVLRVGAGGRREDDGRALHVLEGASAEGEPVTFAAADEGSWGDELTVRLELSGARRFSAPVAGVEVTLPEGLDLPTGSLLRVRGELVYVRGRIVREVAPGRLGRFAVLERPVVVGSARCDADIVTGVLVVVDRDREERIGDLGLHPAHPRFLGVSVAEESVLIRPSGPWTHLPVTGLDPLLPPLLGSLRRAGRDPYPEIDRRSFFDDDALDDDPFDERTHRGASRLARDPEIGMLLIPDLFWAWVAEEPVREHLAPEPAPGFAPCLDPPPPDDYPAPRPRGVLLDARIPGELDAISERQHRVVALAEHHQRFVALLDVPGGLDLRAIARWRSGFASSYAAAYHPWLAVEEIRGSATASTPVPPSAFAAGIVADRERRLGLPWGPANEPARGAVRGATTVDETDHGTLHQLGINVYRDERDGFRLTGARTLSRDPFYRQLTVRRLVTMLRLALDRQSQWVVFEPHTTRLRGVLHQHLVTLLRELYRGGAFAGNSEDEAFFVRSNESVNPPESVALGRLVVEVGVAPAEPLEFVVLRVSREGDGGVRVTEAGDA